MQASDELQRNWDAVPAALHGIRLDGRAPDELLPAEVDVGPLEQVPASAAVRIGDTHVLASARVSIASLQPVERLVNCC
jgi:exosome complex RNA-binding protein Rrp42 (RNase PH superfamily)